MLLQFHSTARKCVFFRRCKDPFILDPRFHPIWVRLKFLREPDASGWKYCCEDLKAFVKAFQMGEYYSKRIGSVLQFTFEHLVAHLRNHGQDVTKAQIQYDPKRHGEHDEFRASEIERLCVEMLRYQDWTR